VPEPRIFLLSPASTSGARADLLFRDGARFDLARRVRTPAGAPLGEVFSFLSGLYFRGKLAYAERFAAPPAAVDGVLVITPGAGLLPPAVPVTLAHLQEFARVVISPENPRYRRPLVTDAEAIAARVPATCPVILLGSVASVRYVEVLAAALGPRLRFPAEFVGRGDMSRGGLLLRCVAEGRELTYVAAGEVARHGPRPPRLPRRARPGFLEGAR
jgi:hypothetical protein